MQTRTKACRRAPRRPSLFASQVTIPYQWNRLHRPDFALLQYGFFQKGRSPPLLAAIDYGGAEGNALRAHGG